MMKLTTSGQFLTGRLVLRNGELIKKFALKNDGKKVWVEIEPIKAKRSLSQNALWHGVWLPIIANELGYQDPEEVCRAIKLKLGLCSIQEDKITGQKQWRCPSTAGMGKSDMSDFLMKVETLMAEEFGITLPAPDTISP